MNLAFTAEDFKYARAMVKRAGTANPGLIEHIVDNPIAYNGPGYYDAWRPSPLTKDTPERQGFGKSLGRTLMGYGAKWIGDPVRSFVGLSPGPSGFSRWLPAAGQYAYGKVTGNTNLATQARRDMGTAVSEPAAMARWESEPLRGAFSHYLRTENPDLLAAAKYMRHPIEPIKKWLASPQQHLVIPSEPKRMDWAQPTPGNRKLTFPPAVP